MNYKNPLYNKWKKSFYNKNQHNTLISQIYFWNRTLLVLERFSVHHQESSIVYTAVGICYTGYADCLPVGSGCSILIPLASSQQNLYDIYLLLCIQYQTPDDGQKTCLKHVEFYSKNKFEKLVYLVGFIIRIYYDARSSECQAEKSCSSELRYHISSYHKANKSAQETMQQNSQMYVASSGPSALLFQTALTWSRRCHDSSHTEQRPPYPGKWQGYGAHSYCENSWFTNYEEMEWRKCEKYIGYKKWPGISGHLQQKQTKC